MLSATPICCRVRRIIQVFIFGIWGLGTCTLAQTYTYQQTYTYHIDAQPLASALTQFAEASDLQVLFPSNGLPTSQCQALIGRFSREQALNLLLKNTNLQYTFGGKNAVAISLRPPKTTPPAPKTTPVPVPAPVASGSVEEVSVTGIRTSLARNLATKHLANATLDAMNAEDVGKFPDHNVADSLQRIPGVSVDRIWGEARDINIRGTDKDVNRTLMNGQNVASAYWWANDNPSRGFNYTILASELIASLVVYKSPEADIDEGSIGGTVVIYTRKPLDLASGTLRATLEEQYSDLAQTYDPQASVLASWKNSDGSLGILASSNWQNRRARRDGLETFPDNTLYNIATSGASFTPSVYAVWGGGSAILQQERKRLTNNLTVQWAPNEHWQSLFNYVDSTTAMDISNQNYLFLLGGFKLVETPPVTVEQPRFGASGDQHPTLLGGIVGNPDSPGAALDAIFRSSYVDSAVYDLDNTYQQDDWKLHLQTGVTSAIGGTHHDRLYRFTGNTREHFELSRNSVEIDYLDLDPKDAASLNHYSSQSRDWVRQMRDHENYAQVDVERSALPGFFSQLEVGFKWRDQTITNNRTAFNYDTQNPLWQQLANISLAQVSRGLSPQLHQQTASAGSLTQYAWADQSLVISEINDRFDQALLHGKPDLQAYYQIEENINATYIKGDFDRDQWRGNLGLRIVETQQDSSAYETPLVNPQLSHSARRYWDYLPCLNLTYDMSDTMVWRASLAKVMARPTFQNLSRNVVIDGTNSYAFSGNPDLQPYRAQQGDLGAEWYFDQNSILSATGFYKSISTFIYTRAETETITGQPLTITRPYNAPEGASITGLELQWQQPLGRGFGWLSNYTYTNATVPAKDQITRLKLPGNSRDQFNASLYYEIPAGDIRLSYNYRSKSYGELIASTQDETNAYSQWDLSASWKPNATATLYAEAINLTNSVIYYRTANNIPQGLYEHGRRFAVGTRFSF